MTQQQTIIDALLAAKSIVITSHKSPDGDSIGSSIGMYRFIQKLGKEVVICHPDKAPSNLEWLEEVKDIVLFETQPDKVKQLFDHADLLICLDFNTFSRVGEEMAPLLENFSGQYILIDHHLYPADFTNLMISEPTVCSTSQLVYELIHSSNQQHLLDAAICTPLYLGMVTDTGSFRFDSVNAHTHRIVANMIELGVVHNKVHENTFDTTSVNQLKLRGFAMAEKLEILHNNTIAIVSLTSEELQRFNYQKGDTEGLANTALSIQGVKAAIMLTEQNGTIRMSFRGKEDYSVNVIASEQFGGGGHKFAAGGSSQQTMSETIERLKSNLSNYFS